MLQPKRVRVVTQTKLFEYREGRDVLDLKEYCEDKPFWNGLLTHAFTGLLLYIVVVLLAVFTAPDWFISLYGQLGNVWSSIIVAVTMALFAVGYSLVCDLVMRKRFARNRSRLCGYRANRKILERIGQEQDI